MKKLLALPLLLLISSFTTCGHRGAPKPPLSYTPKSPKLHQPIQDYNRALIFWEKVKEFEDGRKIPMPQEVYYLVSINFGEKVVKTEESYYLGEPLRVGKKRCFSVTAVYKGKKSKPSEPVCITGKEPIEELPEVVRSSEGDSVVEIELKESPFEVEVFRNQKPPFIKPYRVLKAGQRKLVDKNVENGKTYSYRFRFSQENLKGRLTEPVKLTPKDSTPPKSPRNPVLIVGKVCLAFWEPSPSEDTVGYELITDKGKFFTTGIYYTFNKCPKRLKVVAVDEWGNRSKPVRAEVFYEESGSSNGK